MDTALHSDIDAYIDEVWEDVIADIARLVAHPSVANAHAAEPGAPFGAPARAALDEALGIAKRLGYTVSDDEGYVGMADIAGTSEQQIATIAHVDVVPAGPGWTGDPFCMQRRDGWLVGRGVIDDKGPAVLSLYAGAYMLSRGIRPRHSFRALLGSDEEVGMTDVHHYLERYPEPAFLFTPDAEFPVGNAEKGGYFASIISPAQTASRICSWSGAEASNAIPGRSEALLRAPLTELPQPVAYADRIELIDAGSGTTRVVAHGIGGHASLPEGTLNAIGVVLGYFEELDAHNPQFFSAGERAFMRVLHALLADAYGQEAGIASSNDAFGPLTLNAGTIEVRADGSFEQSIDIRFPDSTTEAELTKRLSVLAASEGATLQVNLVKPPFSVSAESPAVQELLATYSEVTGKPAQPFSMGGGTYARNFAQAVSFGPEENNLELPSFGGPMHGPNECASEALLRQALKIYILALLRLDALDFEDSHEEW
ncbi:Sapep family Mn(2+)-dependent dipeptidase [Collinsella sp. zg1085]|uniref:Sapep family Mn(2+)-dependent dipeptidase n=1 Tax=Collinsella sp. zg1085 TaxID=2844380 RepID=UPI001C0E18C4|nr:Sapep family Mn(2+)-dependent dipeptidase [Collinsella sp. zg1085]QWT17207.1 Sapep family Mn(2+)-dependent dipeptidase [Collinsella sp. zg1085]